MRYWGLSERYLGHVAPSATAFTNAVLEETLLKMQADDDYEAATKETEVQKPIALVNLAKWTKFSALLTTYLSRTKGAANTPLTYLTRKHGEVTTEIAAEVYASNEDHLIATTVHIGEHYDLDNRTLY
jgi:hypothetical protein